MPRNFFKRISRQFSEKKEHHWYMKPFEFVLTHPIYFSNSRRGICGGLWVGCFTSMLPVPAHTLLGILGAMALRVNVPVAAATTWITNPVTLVPIFYFNYKLGALLLNIPPEVIPGDISLHWLMEEIEMRWKPLVFGSVVMAIALSSTVYLATSAIWRLLTMRRYRSRHMRSLGSIKGGKSMSQTSD